MSDVLAALRREAHDLDCRAAECRAAGDIETATHYEADAGHAWARVAAMEHADGQVAA